jgi:polyisoprenyl-teichoic acid--peptidoglycan teichoic acid transferase
MMRYDRMQSKKQKRKKRRKTFLLVLLLILIAVVGYFYFQYQSGVNHSQKKLEGKKVVYTFNGERDENGATNILLIGSDARGNENSRADTIMIAHYHPDKKTFKLTSIMRDTYVDIPGHGKNKINSTFALGGPELLRQTIKENFDLDLQYYTIVDFQGFIQLIDVAFPEGVEVNVEKKMSEGIDVTLEPGIQRLDGTHLLGFVRFRHDAIGDFGRVKRQQETMQNIASELTSLQTIPKLPKLIGVVTPFVNTNLGVTDMISMGTDFVTKEGSIETLRIPVEGSYVDKRIAGVGAVLSIDFDQNKTSINQFLTK